MGKQWKQCQTLFWGAPKSLQMVTAAMKLKALAPWKKSYDQPRQHIKKQKHYIANKGLSSQSYGFSSNHVGMWKLDHKEGWVPKPNWYFRTVVLEKTLESLLGCKEIKSVNPKGDQSWIFIGRTDAEAETPILWQSDTKNWLIGKDPDTGKAIALTKRTFVGKVMSLLFCHKLLQIRSDQNSHSVVSDSLQPHPL